MSRFEILAEGLGFPEGPVVMPDGRLLVCEIAAGRLSFVSRGRVMPFTDTGGGPNGACLGSDGQLYVCNNGGFAWDDSPGYLRPVGKSPDNAGGCIQRVDPASGKVETLYDRCGHIPLSAPNDIVADGKGGLWFTDHGHRSGRQMEFGAVYYAREDGSLIREAAFPLIGPNGIGLLPDGQSVIVAETSSGRLWQYRISGEGQFEPVAWPSPTGGELMAALSGFQRYDSLAVEACGNVAVATLRLGGVNVVSPAGLLVERIALPDPYTTNIAFGGPDMQTAFITLSGSGRLVSMAWARPGLA